MNSSGSPIDVASRAPSGSPRPYFGRAAASLPGAHSTTTQDDPPPPCEGMYGRSWLARPLMDRVCTNTVPGPAPCIRHMLVPMTIRLQD